jgi:hypothetical protein
VYSPNHVASQTNGKGGKAERSQVDEVTAVRVAARCGKQSTQGRPTVVAGCQDVELEDEQQSNIGVGWTKEGLSVPSTENPGKWRCWGGHFVRDDDGACVCIPIRGRNQTNQIRKRIRRSGCPSAQSDTPHSESFVPEGARGFDNDGCGRARS